MPERWLIDAELRPHRSLGRAGFVALMAAVSLASFGAGAAFALAGAWPVLGFFGLDVALVWLAFRLNFRGGRLVERLRLSARSVHRTLRVARTIADLAGAGRIDEIHVAEALQLRAGLPSARRGLSRNARPA